MKSASSGGILNGNQWGWEISKKAADYLRAKYLFESEDEEETLLLSDSIV